VYTQIVVGYDGSAHARDALFLGGVFAQLTGATLCVACVFASRHLFGADSQFERSAREQAESMVSEAADNLPEELSVESVCVPSRSPSHGLHDLAQERGVDLVVVGSSSRGRVGRAMAGSVAERLLHGAPCAVCVAPSGLRDKQDFALGVMGVCYDGSEEARAALEVGGYLAQRTDAVLRVLAVSGEALGLVQSFAYTQYLQENKEEIEKRLDEAVKSLPGQLNAHGQLLEGDPAEVLTAEAESGIDLMISGSRAYGPLGHVLVGTVSAKLVRSALCPVLVVPRAASAAH
jgi:nucleotide-binding universal stress UspA family protein